MTEAFPDPDESASSIFDKIVAAEFGEKDTALQVLLENFHLIYETVSVQDTDTDDALDQIGLIGTVQQQRYTYPGNDPEVMPGSYWELKWIPKERTETALSVQEIFVRHPSIRGEEFDVFDPEKVYTPRDVFVEFVYKNGDNHRYLVNDKGVTPYASGEAVDFSAAEYWDSTREPDTKPNVFSIIGDHWYASPLDAATIDRRIFGESELKHHDKPSA